MADPKRILKKILTAGFDAESFEATGEPLELLVETLREVIRCRRFVDWIETNSGIRSCLTPQGFHSLLEIPEINFSEEADRNLDITRHSLKDKRNADDPITVANLNTLLREMFRELNSLQELRTSEYPRLLLAKDITGDRVDQAEDCLNKMRGLDLKGVGYLVTSFWAKGIEKEFERLFPQATRVHPLRKSMDAVQVELGYYRRCLEINIKWAVTGLDLFRLVRDDTLGQLAENLSSLGNGIWNVVYNGMQIPQSLARCGIDFDQVETLLSEQRVPLRNA